MNLTPTVSGAPALAGAVPVGLAPEPAQPELGAYGGMNAADVYALSGNLYDAMDLDPALASDAGVPMLKTQVDSFVALSRTRGADIVRLGLARDSIASALATSARWYGLEPEGGHRGTDDVLAAALAANKGNRRRTAMALGLCRHTVTNRVRDAGDDSPLMPFKEVKGSRCDMRQRVSDETLAFALEKHGGNRRKVSAETGLNRKSVAARVFNSKAGSPLYPFREIKALYQMRISDGEIAAALEKHGGKRTEAAQDVGLTAGTVHQRIQKAGDTSPLLQLRDKSGARRKRDEEIRLAILKHKGDIESAAKEIGVTPLTIRTRIATSAPDSPLKEFAKTHYSDDEIAEFLDRFSGSRTKVAGITGLSLSGVSRRILGSGPGSSLERFRNLNGELRVGHQYLDRTLAIGLAVAFCLDRENFISLTAGALELGASYLYHRIIVAPDNSPLHVFGPRSGQNISEERAVAALEKSGGDIEQAAGILSIPVASLKAWIRTSSDDSPLAAYRRRVGRSARATRGQIADALVAAHGDVDVAAVAVGLDAHYIRQLIREDDGTRLADFRDPAMRPRKRTDMSDEMLAAALKKNRGNRAATARKIKISIAVIGRRIRRAGPGLPLARFKTLKGIPSRVSDDALALALERHGGSRTKAAMEVELPAPDITYRIRKARPDSKLWPYRSMDGRRKADNGVREPMAPGF